MMRRSRIFRLTNWVVTTSFMAAGLQNGSFPAFAQDAGIPAAGDPPARVGRLSRLEGSVSTHGPDASAWTPAILNFPYTSGDALWTQPQAQADIQVGMSLITLADSSEFDLATLDDHEMVASAPQGALFLDLRDVRQGETYTINTPRGAVQIAADGKYEILAGDADTPTRVAVVRGAAQLTSGTLALRVGPGQMAVATGTDTVQGDVEALPSYDPFLTSMLARNSAQPDVPQAVQGMTGVEGLDRYGSWQDNPGYGQVWYPQVAQDWVPYRDGTWSYVAPWGWTWVDNEPWGFTPFHYGRWAQLDQRWCWVPSQYGAPEQPEPVYAPALVDFLVAGAVAGAAAGLLAASLSSGRGDVGWVPLGPHEAYAPPYGGSSRYRNRLNWGGGWHRPSWSDSHNETRINNTTNNIANNIFINRHALTVAPVGAMARSQQIRPVAHGIESPAAHGFQQASAVQPLQGRLPIRPIVDTHRPSLQRAPGPAITPGVAHQAAVTGGRVPFRNGPLPAATHAAPGRVPPPVLPQPPARPVVPGLSGTPALRPHQPGGGFDAARPANRASETRNLPAPPVRGVVPRPEVRPVVPQYRGPAVAQRGPEPARPISPRVETPRTPAIQRQAPPRPVVMPRMEAPRPQAPAFRAPPFQPRPVQAPHFQPGPQPAMHMAPRPEAPRPGPARPGTPHP